VTDRELQSECSWPQRRLRGSISDLADRLSFTILRLLSVLDLLGQPDDRAHSDLRPDLNRKRRQSVQAEEERRRRDQETHSIHSQSCFSVLSFRLLRTEGERARTRDNHKLGLHSIATANRDRAPRSREAESSTCSELFLAHLHAALCVTSLSVLDVQESSS